MLSALCRFSAIQHKTIYEQKSPITCDIYIIKIMHLLSCKVHYLFDYYK